MTLSVGVVPKSTRNPYFEDCHKGAQEAAEELGFALRWDGPPNADVERQVQIVEEWTKNGLPVMAVSVENSARLTPVLKAARARGTKVLTWDSDGGADARDFTVVHATPESVGHALSFEVARILGGKGSVAAITSTGPCIAAGWCSESEEGRGAPGGSWDRAWSAEFGSS